MRYKLTIEFDVLDENLDTKIGEILSKASKLAEDKRGTAEYGSIPFMHLFPKELRNSDASVIEVHQTNINCTDTPYQMPQSGEISARIIIPHLDMQTIINSQEFADMTDDTEEELVGVICKTSHSYYHCKKEVEDNCRFLGLKKPKIQAVELYAPDKVRGKTFDILFIHPEIQIGLGRVNTDLNCVNEIRRNCNGFVPMYEIDMYSNKPKFLI